MVFSRDEQPKSDDPLGKLRALGYFASCFPEGDGIAFMPPDGTSADAVCVHIADCFGWSTTLIRR